MPDEVIRVYVEASIEREKRPWRVAQYVVMWMAAINRAYKSPKKYSHFDPFPAKVKPIKRSKEEIEAMWKRWDEIKAKGIKTKTDKWP